MVNYIDRLGAGLGAILSIGGISSGSLIDSPGWKLLTQSVAMLVGVVSIVWMICQIVKFIKHKK